MAQAAMAVLVVILKWIFRLVKPTLEKLF